MRSLGEQAFGKGVEGKYKGVARTRHEHFKARCFTAKGFERAVRDNDTKRQMKARDVV